MTVTSFWCLENEEQHTQSATDKIRFKSEIKHRGDLLHKSLIDMNFKSILLVYLAKSIFYVNVTFVENIRINNREARGTFRLLNIFERIASNSCSASVQF